MDLRRQGIIDIFTKLKKEGVGIWFSGTEGEGEFRGWYESGQMSEHSFYDKDGGVHGEYKFWHENGQMLQHSFWKHDKLHGEFKRWHDNGQLSVHAFYKDGEMVKRIV